MNRIFLKLFSYSAEGTQRELQLKVICLNINEIDNEAAALYNEGDGGGDIVEEAEITVHSSNKAKKKAGKLNL